MSTPGLRTCRRSWTGCPTCGFPTPFPHRLSQRDQTGPPRTIGSPVQNGPSWTHQDIQIGFSTDRQRQDRPGGLLGAEVQPAELEYECKRRLARLIAVVDVVPVASVLDRDVCRGRGLVNNCRLKADSLSQYSLTGAISEVFRDHRLVDCNPAGGFLPSSAVLLRATAAQSASRRVRRGLDNWFSRGSVFDRTARL